MHISMHKMTVAQSMYDLKYTKIYQIIYSLVNVYLLHTARICLNHTPQPLVTQAATLHPFKADKIIRVASLLEPGLANC